MPNAIHAYPWLDAAVNGTVRQRLDVDGYDSITLQWHTGANNTGSASAITLYGTVFERLASADPSAEPRWSVISGVGFGSLPASGAGASAVIEVPDGYTELLIEIAATSITEFSLAARLGQSL